MQARNTSRKPRQDEVIIPSQSTSEAALLRTYISGARTSGCAHLRRCRCANAVRGCISYWWAEYRLGDVHYGVWSRNDGCSDHLTAFCPLEYSKGTAGWALASCLKCDTSSESMVQMATNQPLEGWRYRNISNDSNIFWLTSLSQCGLLPLRMRTTSSCKVGNES